MLTHNPLLDKDFLKSLDLEKNKEIYAKIISLDFYENPIESIEGKVTGGNINIDGNSSVRRSCSLTLVSDQVNIGNYEWSLNSKFKLFIGLKNNLNSNYEDIIWFKQGTFIITAFSSTYNVNSYTINITGQDKMCLINGTVGGQLPGSVDFKQEILYTYVYEEVDLGRRYDESYYINNVGTFILDESGGVFDSEKIYYQKIDDNNYEYVKVNRRYYEANKYYLYEPVSDNFSLVTDIYDKNSHYFIKNEDGTFTEVRFENDNYTAHTYYIYNYETNEYQISDDSYNPSLQYYSKKVYQDKTTLPIKTIVREAVHTYAGEPYYNIIINDIDDHGLYLMEYRNENPLYLFFNDGICINTTIEGGVQCYILKDNMPLSAFEQVRQVIREELFYIEDEYNQGKINAEEAEEQRKVVINYFLQKTMNMTNGLSQEYLTTIDDEINITYDTLVENFDFNASYIVFPYEAGDDINNAFNVYTVAKINYGDAAGYKQIDLIYPDDLISSVGDSLGTILDKIKEQFSDFEYFYDVDGRFVFQKKPQYLKSSWNNIVTQDDETYVDNTQGTSAAQYSFEGNELITSVSYNPKIDNLKNDYSVWGQRKGITNADILIHARFAIDKKPTVYKTFPRTKYSYQDEEQQLITVTRSGLKFLEQHVYYSTESEEYQMALEKIDLNPTTGDPVDLCTMAYEKYELEPILFSHYSTTTTLFAGVHIIYHYCDWRELIYQMALDYYKYNNFDDYDYYLKMFNPIYDNGKTGYEKYYVDMEGFWRQLYNPEPEIDFTASDGRYVSKYDFDENTKTVFKREGWQNLKLDYSDLLCDFYLPEYYRNHYESNLEDVKNDLIAEIDKWNSAYDSIKPLVSEEEERLQEFKALKEQAELERIDVLNAKNSDENILAISTNLSEINANIVNEQNMVDQQLEEQQASIKNTLALFGY